MPSFWYHKHPKKTGWYVLWECRLVGISMQHVLRVDSTIPQGFPFAVLNSMKQDAINTTFLFFTRDCVALGTPHWVQADYLHCGSRMVKGYKLCIAPDNHYHLCEENDHRKLDAEWLRFQRSMMGPITLEMDDYVPSVGEFMVIKGPAHDLRTKDTLIKPESPCHESLEEYRREMRKECMMGLGYHALVSASSSSSSSDGSDCRFSCNLQGIPYGVLRTFESEARSNMLQMFSLSGGVFASTFSYSVVLHYETPQPGHEQLRKDASMLWGCTHSGGFLFKEFSIVNSWQVGIPFSLPAVEIFSGGPSDGPPHASDAAEAAPAAAVCPPERCHKDRLLLICSRTKAIEAAEVGLVS